MNRVKLFMEGIVDDALKVAADVDTEEIKKEWDAIDNDPDRGWVDKVDTVDKKGLGKAADHIDDINERLKKEKIDTRSIIARARQSVLSFPVFVSQSLRVNEAHIISKLYERVYASFVQTVLSQNPIMDEDEANNLVFLKKFHTNLTEAAKVFYNEYYEPIDDIDRMMKESVYNVIPMNNNVIAYFCATNPNTYINMESSFNSHELLEGFMSLYEAAGKNEHSSGRETTKSERKEKLDDDDFRNMAIEELDLSDREAELAHMTSTDIRNNEGIINKTAAERQRSRINQRIEDKIKDIKNDIKEREELKRDGKAIPDRLKKYPGIEYNNGQYYNTTVSQTVKKTSNDTVNRDLPEAPKMLKDVELKKINGMLPWPLECTFRLRDKKGGLTKDVHYVLGIKTTLYPIRVSDLSEDLRDIVTGNIKSLQKVRYKSGEIGFWDSVLNIKQIKKDALKNLNGNKKWINTLKRMSEYKKSNGGLLKTTSELATGKRHTPIPNGTLILTQTDVDILKNETGIDISKIGNARKLANSLFLIGLGIVDSTAGTMKVFFPDSDTNWDVQSLSQIDAELSKTDNSKLMSELNKMVNRAS